MARAPMRFKPSIAETKRDRGAVDRDNGEAPVLAAISQLLARHPKVHIAIRHNSGAVMGEATETSARRFVRFNKLLKGRGVLVDFTGTLVDGRPLALEAKRPGWVMPTDAAKSDSALRAHEQRRYIEHVVSIGGVGGFVRSVDEALEVIER